MLKTLLHFQFLVNVIDGTFTFAGDKADIDKPESTAFTGLQTDLCEKVSIFDLFHSKGPKVVGSFSVANDVNLLAARV